MLLLVVITKKQELERLSRQRGDQLRLKLHEQVLVVGQESRIKIDTRILTLRDEPFQVELSSAGLKHVDSVMNNNEQLGDLLQRTLFEANLGFLINEDVIVAGNGGQRASANVNFGVYCFKRACRNLSTNTPNTTAFLNLLLHLGQREALKRELVVPLSLQFQEWLRLLLALGLTNTVCSKDGLALMRA